MVEEHNATAMGKIGKGSTKHPSTEKGNINKETAGTGYIATTTKLWIITPILSFHVAGFIVLLYLAAIFLDSEDDVYQWAWPALIVALAGIPFGFASNVKKLADALTTGSVSS